MTNFSPEPFYMGDGTGDYPHESARYSDFRPGNPARALYRKDDPSNGYIQDFNVFFSPLSKLASAARRSAPMIQREQKTVGHLHLLLSSCD